MRVLFRDNKLGKSLTIEKEINKRYGVKANNIKKRMNELINVFNNLAEIPTDPPQRRHKLSNYSSVHASTGIEYFGIDVSSNYRLIFHAIPQEIPYGPSGEMLLDEVKSIKIIEVRDYHD